MVVLVIFCTLRLRKHDFVFNLILSHFCTFCYSEMSFHWKTVWWNETWPAVCVCVRVVEDGAHPGLAATEARRRQEVQQPLTASKQQQHQGTARPLPAHQPLPVGALAALLGGPLLQPDLTHSQCKHPRPDLFVVLVIWDLCYWVNSRYCITYSRHHQCLDLGPSCVVSFIVVRILILTSTLNNSIKF